MRQLMAIIPCVGSESDDITGTVVLCFCGDCSLLAMHSVATR
jgi:hypothetical protein